MSNEGTAMERRVARERAARKQAEALLETKSRELYQTNQELQHLAANLEKLVEERTCDLVKMKDQALAGNRAKSVFLANMSHELRTPISGIIGLAELILKKPSAVEHHNLAEMIVETSEGLLLIINQVLDLSKLEASQWDLEERDFDLCKIVDDVTNTLTRQIAQKQLCYGAILDPSLPRHLHGDAGRLRQLMTNLISNAVKFTESGSVTVKVGKIAVPEQQLMLQFTVSDTGIGIKEDDHPLIFQKFSQLEIGRTRKNTGTGLGLSICKTMVEILGGKIGFSSTYGKGSAFWFTLPLNLAHQQLQDDIPTVAVVGLIADPCQRSMISSQLDYLNVTTQMFASLPELWQGLQNEAFEDASRVVVLADPQLASQLAEATSAEQGALAALGPYRLACLFWDTSTEQPSISGCSALALPVTFKKLLDTLQFDDQRKRPGIKSEEQSPKDSVATGSILLVEDSAPLQLVTKTLLKKLGFRVRLAANGRDAVEAIKAEQFDLVLMDIQMPEMDGITATQLIRKMELRQTSRLPIVALTAFAMKGDEENFLQAGMDDYLTKPIRLPELKRVLRRWLALEDYPED